MLNFSQLMLSFKFSDKYSFLYFSSSTFIGKQLVMITKSSQFS
jgi:hypothetical protein